MSSNPIMQFQDVFTMAAEAQTISGSIEIASLTRLADDLTNTSGALNYTLTGFINQQRQPHLHITVQGTLAMVCQRCLEPLSFEVDVDNVLHMVHSEADLDSEEDELNAILAGSDAPEKMVGSDMFDIFNLIEDEVILSIPVANTHDVCDEKLPTSSGQKASAFDVLAKLK
jgi:uncharacterized protein